MGELEPKGHPGNAGDNPVSEAVLERLDGLVSGAVAWHQLFRQHGLEAVQSKLYALLVRMNQVKPPDDCSNFAYPAHPSYLIQGVHHAGMGTS
jgi:hypothetical protein